MYADGTTENLGPVAEDVHPLLDEQLRLRAGRMLRDRFGGVGEARDVLNSLTAVLDDLDGRAVDGSADDQEPGRRGTGS